jgi:hypothetical protein
MIGQTLFHERIPWHALRDQFDVFSFKLLGLGVYNHLVRNALASDQCLESGPFDAADMDENFLVALAVGDYKAVLSRPKKILLRPYSGRLLLSQSS